MASSSSSSAAAPKKVDWSSFIKSPIREQVFNTCWAIVMASCVEAMYNIMLYNKRVEGQTAGSCEPAVAPAAKLAAGIGEHAVAAEEFISLSCQLLINNASDIGLVGKKGKKTIADSSGVTTMAAVCRWVRQNGIWKEKDCPFSSECRVSRQPRKNAPAGPVVPPSPAPVRVHKHETVEKVNDGELLKLVSKRPVMGIIRLHTSFAVLDSGEVYRHPVNGKNGMGFHAVLIVGFGTTSDGVKYWKIRNSYGVAWSDAGYGMLIREAPGHSSIFQSYSYVDVDRV